MRLQPQALRLSSTMLALALAWPVAGWAGASGTARLTHLSFKVYDLAPDDGQAPGWGWTDPISSASASLSDGVPMGASASDSWGGNLGSAGTASASLAAATATASSVGEQTTGYIGGLALLTVDAEIGYAGLFFAQTRFTIAPNTRLVVYGRLDLGVQTDGNNDVLAFGSVSFNLDAGAGLPMLNTYGNAGSYLPTGAPASGSFSGVLGWYVDNRHATATRGGWLSVDIGVQTFGSDGVGAANGSIPALPVLAAIATSAPEVPAELLPAIPEPGTSALLLAGLALLGLAARRRGQILEIRGPR